MSDCILCGQPLPEESFLSLSGMPSCAQNIPDKDSLHKDSGMDLNLFQCRSCGLVQLDCAPVPDYRDVIRAGGGTKTMTDLRKAQYAHFIDKCHLSGKRILEVGCGQGEFLEMLRGFNVYGFGIENNQALVDCRSTGILREMSGMPCRGLLMTPSCSSTSLNTSPIPMAWFVAYGRTLSRRGWDW